MTPYILQTALDLVMTGAVAAVFIFLVWSLSEVCGLARSGRRPAESSTAPVPRPESAPENDLLAAGRR